MDRNANAYSELFYHCVQALNEYTDNISEETFLEQYFQANKVRTQSSLLSVWKISSFRFRMNRLYRQYCSIVFDIRHCSKQSLRYSMQLKERMFENQNRISTKV